MATYDAGDNWERLPIELPAVYGLWAAPA